MGATGSHLIFYPSVDQIININRVQLRSTGENFLPPDNLRVPDAVETALIAIREPVYGEDVFPTLLEKVAVLSWKIAADHIFWEGNKRTGMLAGMFMLEINGLRLNATSPDVIKVGELVGTYKLCGFTRQNLIDWYANCT